MPVGEIIAIGTELLLGEIQDTNTVFIARTFRDAGIDLYRTMIVGDNSERISHAINEAFLRADIVITTGGLGPTVDDPTRSAVAKAFSTDLEFHPELWDQIQNRFQRFHRQATGNNQRQAYIPHGAIPIENQVGTAPAFYIENGSRILVSLPGVPREMEHILKTSVMPLLSAKYELKGIIKAYVLHTAGVGESQVDEWIGDLETQANPTVGLLAHPGQVDIRVTVKAASEAEADTLITEMVKKIRERVKGAIYGSNQETLEGVLSRELNARGWSLAVFESGLGQAIAQPLETAGISAAQYKLSQNGNEPEFIKRLIEENRGQNTADVILGVKFDPGDVRQDLSIALSTPNGFYSAERSYGGPPQSGPAWAVQTTLDFIRRKLD